MTNELPSLSVSQFLNLLNETLRLVPEGSFVIEGEVADYKVSQGKWINFTLKDEAEEARIGCFATTFQRLPDLEDGMRVQVTGYAKVFEKFGKLSLNVSTVSPVGEGALKKAYELLKARLTAEGIFLSDRKRSLPIYPEKIGLITSREAAAYGDFLRILGNRLGGLTVIHADVHVQGQYAVEDIVSAFTALNSLGEDTRPEVIVLTRGGGSLEELHAFNDERVVRAIFSSSIPVIVGVGHERDETLSDFAADVRASTPSNAAERLVFSREQIASDIYQALARIEERWQNRRHILERAIERAIYVGEGTVARISNHLEGISIRLEQQMSGLMKGFDNRVTLAERILQSVNPKAVLRRGFAIVRRGGKVVADAKLLKKGEVLKIEWLNGETDVMVGGGADGNQSRLF